MDAGKFQLIREADRLLSRCGRYMPPVGSVVYIPKSWLVQAVLPTGSDQTFYKEITGDTTWCWRSISAALSANPPAVSAQVLTPDGHFLFNGLLDLTLVAGFGSNRYLLSKEIECPPGSKVQLSLDDNFLTAGAVQPVSMLFGGAYAYYLRDGIRSRCPEQEASDLPRIFNGPNQNILAPSWMYGEGPKTPPGFIDEAFTYGNGISNVVSITAGTGSQSARATIQMDNDIDFQVRRFLFDFTGEVSAEKFLVRIRSGSGYVFTDDYINADRLIGSAYFAKGLDVPRGDQIVFDFVLVSDTGETKLAAVQVFADGVKRRRAS